jgi:kynureninase
MAVVFESWTCLYHANWEKIMITREDCLALDAADPLKNYRQRFFLPPDTIYFDGNSLGPLPTHVQATVAHHLNIAWGVDLITSWNKHSWFELPQRIGDKIGRLIGGGAGNTIVADTISVNMFKALTSALALRRERKIILSDSGNFPSDLYVAQGLNQFLNDGHALQVVAPEDVSAHITEDVAVVMLTEVDYRTCRRHDMKAITQLAHDKGCLIIWDLAHSAGSMPIDLLAAEADFAVGCTYKYLNGGPGSQAFIWVNPKHQKTAQPALVGWWGHANPFAFDLDWKPADGLVRQQCGTQGILSLVALDAAMDVWTDVDMQVVQHKAHSLCRMFAELVENHCGKFGVRMVGPVDFSKRGSHVSFECPDGYAVMQALIAHKVIGDFRAPNMIRFGLAPLYNSFVEMFDAAATLTTIMENRLWDTPEFKKRKSVT